MAARSFLYVPGNRAEWLVRAESLGADAILADLEDAVAPSEKVTARECVASWLASVKSSGVERWVRVNGFAAQDDVIEKEVAAVVRPGVDGIVLPKFENADELARLAELVAGHERRAGLPSESVGVVLMLESARGFQAAEQLSARPSRLRAFHLGEMDLAADLAQEPGRDELELLPSRWQVVRLSALLGIEQPIAGPSSEFHDLDWYKASTESLRRLGFGARAAIHPAQIGVINSVFTPSEEAVRKERDVVARFDESIANGHGALVDAEGRMVDLAVVRSARRIVALAQRAQRA